MLQAGNVKVCSVCFWCGSSNARVGKVKTRSDYNPMNNCSFRSPVKAKPGKILDASAGVGGSSGGLHNRGHWIGVQSGGSLAGECACANVLGRKV